MSSEWSCGSNPGYNQDEDMGGPEAVALATTVVSDMGGPEAVAQATTKVSVADRHSLTGHPVVHSSS